MFSKFNYPEFVLKSSLEETPIVARETHDSSENQAGEDEKKAPGEDAGAEEGGGKFWIFDNFVGFLFLNFAKCCLDIGFFSYLKKQFVSI